MGARHEVARSVLRSNDADGSGEGNVADVESRLQATAPHTEAVGFWYFAPRELRASGAPGGGRSADGRRPLRPRAPASMLLMKRRT